MKIIRHRINNPADVIRNDLVEIDVRDHDGRPCVSHDTIHGYANLILDIKYYLNVIEKQNVTLLAVNIKSDGLEKEILEALDNSGIDYFLFDMSKPSYHTYQQLTNKIALPVSEYDSIADLGHYKMTNWIWLDCFNSNVEAQAKQYNKIRSLHPDINIVFVAPDLHGKSELNSKLLVGQEDKHLYICTDFPEDFE